MYKIISNQQIGNDFYIMAIEGSFEAKPGQFYMLRGIGSFMTLSRPISVFDVEEDKIAFMYRVVVEGTKYFSKLKEVDEITLAIEQGVSQLRLGHVLDSDLRR